MLKSILTEGLSVLNPDSITIYFFQLFLTIFVISALKLVYKLKNKETIMFPILTFSMVLTMLLPFVKFSTPLAIVLLGLVLLFQNSVEIKKLEVPFLVLGLGTALSIGSGFWVLGIGGFCLTTLVLIVTKK